MKPARLLGIFTGVLFTLLLALTYTQRSYLHFLIPEPVFAVPATFGQAKFAGSYATFSGTMRATQFIDNSNNAYYLDPAGATSLAVAGSVGIGTTAPGTKLHVVSSTTTGGTPNASDTLALERSGANLLELISNTDSASVQGLVFSDNNYGYGRIYYTQSTNIMDFYSNNVYTMSLNNGNVGIGTTGPGGALHLYRNNAANDSPQLILENADTAEGRYLPSILFKADDGVAGGGTLNIAKIYAGFVGGSAWSNARLTFQSSIANVLTDTLSLSNGNVGIGTVSPNATLAVNGNIKITWLDDNYNMQLYTIANDTELPGFGAVSYAFKVANAGYGSSPLDVLTLKYNGNVGIGTTGPNEKLEVAGALSVTGVATTNSANKGTIDFNSGIMRFLSYGTDASTYGKYRFITLTSTGTAVNAVEILGNGNVGIGTTNPGQKLQVNGTIKANDSIGLGPLGGNQAGALTWGSADEGILFLAAGGVNKVALYSNGISYFNGGNVGIGTTGPAAKLDVEGADGPSVAGTTPNGTLFVGNTLTNSSGVFLTAGVDATGTVSNAWLQTRNKTLASYYNLVLNPLGGNVGIGQTVPGSLLSVAGGISAGTYSATAAPANGMIISGNVGIGTTAPSVLLEIAKAAAGTPSLRIGTVGTGALSFEAYQAGHAYNEIISGNNQHLVLSTSGTGNVGIGTTAPGTTYKLNVAGSIYASGSSRDYKEHIGSLELDSSKIYQLNPVSFDYKQEYKQFGKDLAGGRQFGLIAEDVYTVYPELTLSNGSKKVANVDYEKLSVLLLAEMKKLKSTIDQQQKQIDQLQTILGVSKEQTKP